MRRWLSGGSDRGALGSQTARHATGVWYQDRSFIGSAVICALILVIAGLWWRTRQ
jgi:hypothetical protein